MIDLIKSIEYEDNQLLLVLDFWGTKVLLKMTLPTKVILSILRANYPIFKDQL